MEDTYPRRRQVYQRALSDAGSVEDLRQFSGKLRKGDGEPDSDIKMSAKELRLLQEDWLRYNQKQRESQAIPGSSDMGVCLSQMDSAWAW